MDSQQTPSAKLDVYQIITNRIIELLEQGTIPWKQPWASAGLPRNLLSKRHYRGINLWLLLSLQYEENAFLTWDQIKTIGGSVNKDEKGHIVVFWKNVKKQPEEPDENNQPKMIPMLRYYKVFNIAQCRDIPAGLLPEKLQPNDDCNPLHECEAILHSFKNGPTVRSKEQRAYYHIAEDYINMPKKKSFKNTESYYATLFHELVHSTGHEKRLGRTTVTDMHEFGSEAYSQEELVAEMGAAFLCSLTGIGNAELENSAAYIKGWLQKLENDKKFIVQASGQAQKAVDLILDTQDQPYEKHKDALDGQNMRI
jgi:antirestriction protein ArdC